MIQHVCCSLLQPLLQRLSKAWIFLSHMEKIENIDFERTQCVPHDSPHKTLQSSIIEKTVKELIKAFLPNSRFLDHLNPMSSQGYTCGDPSWRRVRERNHEPRSLCLSNSESDWVNYLWPHNFLTNDNHARIGYISIFDCGPSVQMKSQ